MFRRNKKVLAVVMSILTLVLSSVPVFASEKYTPAEGHICNETNFSISTRSVYVEPCWICNKGNISYDQVRINRYFTKSEKCSHGFTKGTDDFYTVEDALVYSCDVCSYGWTEHLSYTDVECHGYN